MTETHQAYDTGAPYDILLVYSFSRVHAHYLNIVKALSGGVRVGVYLSPAGRRSEGVHRLSKLTETERTFINTLAEAGAELVDGLCETRLLVFPNNGLSGEYVREVAAAVRHHRVVGFECFGYGPQLLDVLRDVGVHRFFVFDREIFGHKLDTPEKRELAASVDVVEMGSPCLRHPAFDLPSVDYMVALPTQLLLGGWPNRRRFLCNIERILGQIPSTDSVVLKFHNVLDGGNRYFRERMGRMERLVSAVSGMAWGVAGLLDTLPGTSGMAAKFGNRANDLMFTGLARQMTPLAKLTPKYNLNLELFLPHVRKGVITGISTCVWHALHAGLAVYNCDDQPFSEHLPNCSTYRSFYVPPCEGRLEFDPVLRDCVSASALVADFPVLLLRELNGLV
jgi:hypothetical protein